jgi:hypothetical protein
MAAGSRDGNGAHITCIDPWGEPLSGHVCTMSRDITRARGRNR